MEIQPRSFGDALGDLIKMLGKVWRPLLMPALVGAAIVAAVSYFAFETSGSSEFFDLAFTDPEALEQMSEAEALELFRTFFAFFGLVAGLSSLIYGYLYLVAARAVGDAVASTPSGRSLTVSALVLMLSWVVATVLTIAGTLALSLLLILPGIWFGVTMSMVTPVLALEERGPLGAMRRSFELVKGNWWETLGFLLLVGLIGGTAAQLTQFVAIPLFMSGNFSLAVGISIALSVAVQGLIIVAVAVAAAVWYLNLRARTDGPYVLEVT